MRKEGAIQTLTIANEPPPILTPRQATGQARVNAAAVKAKIAFQGDDEFSVASLDPESWKPPVKLAERDVQEKEEEKPEDGSFIWKAFRRVFSR